jgi:hypothetical protein
VGRLRRERLKVVSLLVLDDAAAAGEAGGVVDGLYADGFPGGWGVDHLAVADVEADVVDLCVGVAVEDEVAGSKPGLGYSCGGVVLGVGGPGELHAG